MSSLHFRITQPQEHIMKVTPEDLLETEDDSLSSTSSHESFSSSSNKDHSGRVQPQVGDQRRYAVKQLSTDRTKDEKLVQAMTVSDIANEASFLRIVHQDPYIRKLRDRIGVPETNHLLDSIDLDRFVVVMTLQDKMLDWKKYEQYSSKKRILKKVLRRRQPSMEEQLDIQKQIYGEKLMAIYDIALALKHLADNRIIFRDLNPSNLGFDVHGALRLVDFGLAKELEGKSATSPDMYNLTAMTGSHMAPEVIQSKAYGLSADVYSFGLVVWEIMSNSHVDFSSMTPRKLVETVVQKQRRPNIENMITNKQVLPKGSRIHELVELCWSHESSNRPSIETICDRIYAEILLHIGER